MFSLRKCSPGDSSGETNGLLATSKVLNSQFADLKERFPSLFDIITREPINVYNPDIQRQVERENKLCGSGVYSDDKITVVAVRKNRRDMTHSAPYEYLVAKDTTYYVQSTGDTHWRRVDGSSKVYLNELHSKSQVEGYIGYNTPVLESIGQDELSVNWVNTDGVTGFTEKINLREALSKGIILRESTSNIGEKAAILIKTAEAFSNDWHADNDKRFQVLRKIISEQENKDLIVHDPCESRIEYAPDHGYAFFIAQDHVIDARLSSMQIASSVYLLQTGEEPKRVFYECSAWFCLGDKRPAVYIDVVDLGSKKANIKTPEGSKEISIKD